MQSLLQNVQHVNGRAALHNALQQAEHSLRQRLSRQLNQWLKEAVTLLLGRQRHQRRLTLSRWLSVDAQCSRCGSRHSRHFSRNGSRPRTIHLLNLSLHLRLPRVMCQCGGSVQLNFGGFPRPYQRLGDDVPLQVRRWGALCLSLRQMQQELGHCFIGALGLRTLMQHLHQLQELTPDIDAQDVPPVLQIDGVWLTHIRPNGRFRTDSQGRRRPVKGRFKRPVLIAMGLWPETGRREILTWHLAEDESHAAWLGFLTLLEELGIRGENGLELIIHDGGSGLCSALQTVYFDAAQQRCLFHKLRNIAQALQLPEGLSRTEQRRRRRALMRDFRAIWDAKQPQTAIRRYLHVVRKYRTAQPQAVATLRRDFRATLTFYLLEARHPKWPRGYLRTISHLERFNRHVRQRTRAANAYHSESGILAMIAQEADQYYVSHSEGT